MGMALSCLRATRWSGASRRLSKIASSVLASLLLATAVFVLAPSGAEAVPSFARQTGQPCASCHTAFPELTPFGRRFKLGGYTLEGGESPLPLTLAATVQ